MKSSGAKSGNTLDQIKQLEMKREERRKQMEELKKQKEERKILNAQRGKNVDIDFELMIQKNKFADKLLQPHTQSSLLKLSVCIRKRPIFKKQEQGGEIDAVSCANPKIKIHQPKYKVDGITKYIQNHLFTFDNTFNEEESGDQVYRYMLKPLIPSLFEDGIVTCFAYGQTGSGKTFTMNGIQEQVVNQLFDLLLKTDQVTMSFFQIYGGRCYDLLNQKNPLNILEDKNNNIQIQGLVDKEASSPKELFSIMQQGNSNRTTHSTAANDTSSRSHSICQISVLRAKSIIGKLVLVDLAGSERAQDTQSNNRQRRIQGAQINKSLLALKECIRAMDEKAEHVPFRASKLTLVLRDSFVNKSNNCKIVMIACISPGSSSADHSLNTLRYADRLKERGEGNKTTEILQQKPQNYQSLQKNQSQNDIKKQILKKQILKPKQPQPKPQINKPSQTKVQKQEIKPPTKVQKKPEQTKYKSISSQKKYYNNSSKDKQQQVEEQIQTEVAMISKSKIKDDLQVMKETFKDNNQQFFNFQEKVSSVLEEQEQLFAYHMATIKEDAKILTKESQIISGIQGDGFMNHDIDCYVSELQKVIRRKMLLYSQLQKRLQNFKNTLREEDQVSKNVKDTMYY